MDAIDMPANWLRAGRLYLPFLIVLNSFAPGCTSQRLQLNTVGQARTVADLEYQQILDNLATFTLNPVALPSLVTLKSGASQVGDTGSAGFVGTAGLATRFGSSPTFTGTRTIVDQWASAPMTDDNNLLLVRKAFRSAVGVHDLIEEDEANDLAHDLSSQVGTTADMSVDRDTLNQIYSQNVIGAALKGYLPADSPAGATPPKLTDAQLEVLSRRLSKVSEILDRNLTYTLDPEVLRRSYGFTSNLPLQLLFDKIDAYELEEISQRPKDTIVVGSTKGDIDIRIYKNNGELSTYKLSKTDPRGAPFQNALYEQASAKGGLGEEPDGDERRQLIAVVVEMAGLKDSLKKPFAPLQYSSTGQSKEVINRLNDAQDVLDKISSGWFHCGKQKPKDACYVGHATFCGQECYVWVCNDGLDKLSEFTRAVLKLGSTFREVQVINSPSGIQFSPALTNTSR